MTATADLRAWILTDGKAASTNQCLGLAEALSLDPVVKRIAPRLPWRLLPPGLWVGALGSQGADGDPLRPPWPDILIATARQTAAPSIAIRRASGGATFTVQILDPRIAPSNFDAVVVPRHDGLSGDNVIVTEGALHRVTPARLAEGAAAVAPALAALPRPLVAVLVGGTNNAYRFDETAAEALADALSALCRESGAGLAVTASRRTGPGPRAILERRLAALPAVLWDGSGDNPYFGYLGLADAIVVTADSVSMVSEACATGKPVLVFDLEGGSPKFDRFHRNMREKGWTRPFTGALERWTAAPPNDVARAAEAIRGFLAARGRTVPGAVPESA